MADSVINPLVWSKFKKVKMDTETAPKARPLTLNRGIHLTETHEIIYVERDEVIAHNN